MEHMEEEHERELHGSAEAPAWVRVRSTVESERRAVQEELQLLAMLEVDGLGAVPTVLEIEDDGYTRESAPPLRRRTGRHAADDGAPSTAERLALARAREDLDALIDALHKRGWVLGAPPSEGLGVRADGSVVVRDLDGLRRDEELRSRQRDRHWVDSVLQDQERTLRRRVHRVGSAPAGADLPAVVPPAFEGGAADDAPTTQRTPERPETALPAPRGSVRRRGPGSPSRTATSVVRGLRALVQEVLGQPRLRRIAAMSAAVVLVLGGGATAGAWWLAHDTGPGPEQGSTPSTTEPAPAAAPVIEDPWELAAELAGARHAYITRVSEAPVALPGSAALDEDRRIRRAYRDHVVHGGGPVVHEAELLEVPDQRTAVLRAVTSTAEHQLEDPAGRITEVAATEPTGILLSLRWDGGRWLIESAVPEEAGPPETSG